MKTIKATKSSVNQNVACAFYRVSTDEQTNDRQIVDVRKYCKAYGYKLPKENEFKEIISGASKLEDRKELQKMLEYVEAKRPEFVVCSELSRLARADNALTIIKDWTSKGICFITLKEGIRTIDVDGSTNPMTDLLLKILNAVNVFELETIRYRVKSGLNKTVNAGNFSGGAVPYGYSLKDKRLSINVEEASTVQLMFEKYANNWGSIKIASYLNRNKITTKQGKTWKDTTVYKVLSNSLYVGQRIWNAEPIPMPELQIVDTAIFTAVQRRLSQKQNVTDINKHNKYDYLLSGKIVCSCGKHMIGQGRHNFYMCKSKKYGAGCNIKSIKLNWLDEEVQKTIAFNYTNLLADHSSIIDKTQELQEQLQELQDKINDEKTHQNYLINNMVRIGQQTYAKKYDASTEYVKQLQEQIDAINIKLNNNQNFINATQALSVMQLDDNAGGKPLTKDHIVKTFMSKELLQKVIDRIDVDNDKASVMLINGCTFNINRKKVKA